MHYMPQPFNILSREFREKLSAFSKVHFIFVLTQALSLQGTSSRKRNLHETLSSQKFRSVSPLILIQPRFYSLLSLQDLINRMYKSHLSLVSQYQKPKGQYLWKKKQQGKLDNNNLGFSLQSSSPLPVQLKEATSQMRKVNLGSERKEFLAFIKVRGSHGNLVTALILSHLFQDTQSFFDYNI